jgi:hypothetical protein
MIDCTYKLYKVKRTNLSGYCTSKTEAPKGKYRRPPDKYLVDDNQFLEGLKSEYNKIQEQEVQGMIKRMETIVDTFQEDGEWLDLDTRPSMRETALEKTMRLQGMNKEEAKEEVEEKEYMSDPETEEERRARLERERMIYKEERMKAFKEEYLRQRVKYSPETFSLKEPSDLDEETRQRLLLCADALSVETLDKLNKEITKKDNLRLHLIPIKSLVVTLPDGQNFEAMKQKGVIRGIKKTIVQKTIVEKEALEGSGVPLVSESPGLYSSLMGMKKEVEPKERKRMNYEDVVDSDSLSDNEAGNNRDNKDNHSEFTTNHQDS